MTTEENLACAKAAQRRQGIAARRALSPEARQAADAAICARTAALPQWQKAGRVLAYAAFGGEPDLSALLAGCGKQVAYPICGEECSMRAACPAPVDGWTRGAYGIRTPVEARARILPPEALDLVLVPCTAFDADCRRVGMGKGYYDRYLPQCTGAAWFGVAYEAQKVDAAAAGPLDVRLDGVITERGIYLWK